jgi:signal transduction histidine kinase/ActR/RegA family two-component response regulator
MPTQLTMIQPRSLKRLSAGLGLFAFIAGAICLSGWAFDIPRLTDWLNDGISVQPNTTVLIALAGAAVFLLQCGYSRITVALAGIVVLGGALNLLQYITGADLGFNHQLLFGRDWGHAGTTMRGRFGPPASASFVLIGISLIVLGGRDKTRHRYAVNLSLVVALLMMFSLLGYLFNARNFYAIPWLSAIALPSAIMLMALAVSIITSVPQHQPMLLLNERSSAGSMARTMLPIVIVIIPLFIWLRTKGYEHNLFDLGTSRALGAAMLMLSIVVLMWFALLALRRREQHERETDRRKDEFLATLAHELRNPLAPISNATAMLKLAQGDPVASVWATDIIERQTAQLVRLVDDLLDLSRVNSGKMELRCEPIELAAVIHQALETCSVMIESAHQTLTVELPQQPIYLDADPVRLAQVVSNLLNNACKFAQQGGRISLIVERQDNQVVIRVKDSGIGILADKLVFIFEMFSQVDQSLERTQAGLGIGLTLSKRLVELHSGSIEAFSDGLDKGSEFVVRLPITLDQTPPLEEPADANRPDTRKRILIVDDNVDSAESLAEVLKVSGNEIFLAHDGEEAVATAEMQRPDVILLDIGLPKLNGFNACRLIRENSWAENILIIALTGWGQQEDRRKSAEAGFNNHLVKPVDLAELMNLLDCHSSRN